MSMMGRLARFAKKPPREQLRIARAKIDYQLIERGWKVPHLGNDKTVYILGLFGSGRHYLNDLMLQRTGRRAQYFRECSFHFRFHPGPTSMIYSGHSTMKYESWGHRPPAVTTRIVEAVKARYADMIFIYRHPLDSLLTNWVWMRTFDRHQHMVPGISQVYKNTDDLCAALEENFLEFKTFADGAPEFFTVRPSLRFMSFSEFVEELGLFLAPATLTLRIEDCASDPSKEFLKIAKLMALDVEFNLATIPPPDTTAYRFLQVKEKVPQFRDFIDGLNQETKARIEKIGYRLD
jgi:hypothetical protein